MKLYLFVTALAVFLFVGNVPAFSQISAETPSGREKREDPAQAEMRKRMTQAANKERQEQLEKDTERLLKLATELKEYVNKTNKDILSLDVVKKADEIEKLAHSVKEKMKTSY